MKPFTAGGSPLLIGGSPLVRKQFRDVVDWSHSWDMGDATTYDDGGTTRVHEIPDRSGNRPLIRDQGFYGPTYLSPICDGPLYIPASERFNGQPAMIGEAGTAGTLPLLASTADPTDTATWFGDGATIPQPYWCAVLVVPLEDGSESVAWDAMQGALGTTVSIFTDVTGDDWGCTTGVRGGGLDPWPDTTVDQNPNATVLLIVNVDGTDSFFEFNVIVEAGTMSTVRITAFDLAADAPAREIFFGWTRRGSYWHFGGIKAGDFDEADFTALRAFAQSRMPRRDNNNDIPAEP